MHAQAHTHTHTHVLSSRHCVRPGPDIQLIIKTESSCAELGTCGIFGFLKIKSTYFLKRIPCNLFFHQSYLKAYPQSNEIDRKGKKYHFSLLNKLKNTASAQLWHSRDLCVSTGFGMRALLIVHFEPLIYRIDLFIRPVNGFLSINSSFQELSFLVKVKTFCRILAQGNLFL